MFCCSVKLKLPVQWKRQCGGVRIATCFAHAGHEQYARHEGLSAKDRFLECGLEILDEAGDRQCHIARHGDGCGFPLRMNERVAQW